MPTLTLNITGNANISRLAEQANLRISTSSRGSKKPSVSDEVLTAAKYVEDMIRQVQIRGTSSTDDLPISHWSQTSLSTTTSIEYLSRRAAEGWEIAGDAVTHDDDGRGLFGRTLVANNDESMLVPVRNYRARIEFDVRFRDFALMSEFSSHLTSLDHCDIDSLSWVLLPTTEEQYKSQLRRQAAEDARAKVKDYCQIVCPGEDVSIIPTKLLGENIDGRLFATADRIRGTTGVFGGAAQTALFGSARPQGASANAAADLSFTPQEINMSLSVDLIFEIETNGFKLSTI